jgi:hypothetical protein
MTSKTTVFIGGDIITMDNAISSNWSGNDGASSRERLGGKSSQSKKGVVIGLPGSIDSQYLEQEFNRDFAATLA